MVDPRIVSDWLNKADDDFGFASTSLEEDLKYFGHICFHFQQAAEKYLKAFIVAKGLPLRKIHNLIVLLDSCREVDATLEELRSQCQTLNRYYVDTRYPVHWPTNFTQADAEEAMGASRKIAERIKNSLKAT